ncbi:hypothetical protein HDU98_005742, partial [Podochytrium sp. JEL0797]
MHILTLVTLAATAIHAKTVGNGVTGHWSAGMTQQIALCDFTFQVNTPTDCESVAAANSVSIAIFTGMNKWLDCSAALAAGTVVCVPSAAPEESNGTLPPSLQQVQPESGGAP